MRLVIPAFFGICCRMKLKILLIAPLFFTLASCAQSKDQKKEAVSINKEFDISHPNDPFESFNRVMWNVNYDLLDPYFIRPISLGYVHIIPQFARTGVENFIANLEAPMSTVNSLLMLDGKNALHHFNRFWINSTFGLVGILDIASAAGLQKRNQHQFGDVMGAYHIGQGPYFMVPIYGPLTLREGAGDLVDGLYPPLSWLTLPQSLVKFVLNGMEVRAAAVSQEQILANSPDPYIFVRDAYLQYKAFSARSGNEEEIETLDDEYLDEFMDEIDDY